MAERLKIEKSKQKSKWNIFAIENINKTQMIIGPRTEIIGNQSITVEGCLGVLEYKSSYIKLRLSKGALILCGSKFDITFFENRLITVKGEISSIEFCI